jgi:hypothetical protein
MQLVAYGAQDIYLTGNPMITYFKVVYRRHTNFAMESIEQTFNGTANFGNKVSCLISRNGDLIHGIYLQATLPNLVSTDAGSDGLSVRWIDNIGHFLIKQVDLEIGGQLIDRQYGDWLEIWSQLTVPAGQKVGYLEMIGQDVRDALGRPTGLQADVFNASSASGATIRGRVIYVPLQFWFCRNVGLALPLIALQYHEVKVNLEFQTQANLVSHTSHTVGALSSASLWVDYIYLDTDERRRFAQVSHEYLIEQLQYGSETSATASANGLAGTTVNIDINFNHPVKELVWVCQADDVITGASDLNNQRSNYTNCSAVRSGQTTHGGIDELGSTGLAAVTTEHLLSILCGQGDVRPPGSSNPIRNAKLVLNGHDRFTTRPGSYFNLVQCRDHHTNVPASPGINVYSFALKPEDHQPSGTCNFSRIDNAKLVLEVALYQTSSGWPVGPGSSTQHLAHLGCKIRVYAVNYNVLRVMSGMAGLAYSN